MVCRIAIKKRFIRKLAIFYELLRVNVIKTIWFNFKMLPLKQAIYFPFFFYGKVSFRDLRGG